MTDFTPGPYVAAEFEHPQPGEYWATIKATGDVWIADVYAVDDAVTTDQAKANALLLTEAPELHDALADLIARIERDALIQMRDLMPARRALAHVAGRCYVDAGRPCEIHTGLQSAALAARDFATEGAEVTSTIEAASGAISGSAGWGWDDGFRHPHFFHNAAHAGSLSLCGRAGAGRGMKMSGEAPRDACRECLRLRREQEAGQ